jgi:hypothetical protein
MSEEPLVERDMHIVEAGEASGAAAPRAVKTTRVFCVAASE